MNGSGNDLSAVRFVAGEGPESALDGLTISGGGGTPVELNPEGFPGFFFHFGGGIFCDGSDPVIRRCRVVNNHAMWGGGIAGIDASPVITDWISPLPVAMGPNTFSNPRLSRSR